MEPFTKPNIIDSPSMDELFGKNRPVLSYLKHLVDVAYTGQLIRLGQNHYPEPMDIHDHSLNINDTTFITCSMCYRGNLNAYLVKKLNRLCLTCADYIIHDEVKPGQKNIFEEVKLGQKNIFEEVKLGQKNIFEEVKPSQKNIFEEVKSGQKNIFEEVKPGQKNIFEEVKPGQKKYF